MPRSEKQQPRRTTGSEGALIKLKNIVAALYPHACSSTQRIQKREKTDRRAEKPGHLRAYVRETRKKITWRERVYERERERGSNLEDTFSELIRQEVERKGPNLKIEERSSSEIVAISVMEINEIIGIVTGVEGEKMIARKTVDPLNSAIRNRATGIIAGWLTSFFISLGGINDRGQAIRGRLILIRYRIRRMETNR